MVVQHGCMCVCSASMCAHGGCCGRMMGTTTTKKQEIGMKITSSRRRRAAGRTREGALYKEKNKAARKKESVCVRAGASSPSYGRRTSAAHTSFFSSFSSSCLVELLPACLPGLVCIVFQQQVEEKIHPLMGVCTRERASEKAAGERARWQRSAAV